MPLPLRACLRNGILCSSRREEALINGGMAISRRDLSLLTSAATFSKEALRVTPKLEADGLAVDATQERELDLPDPDDEPFLGVALAGQVNYLVTGNLSDYPAVKGSTHDMG